MAWDWEEVRGGGAAFEGLGSMGAVSIGEAEVEARRVCKAERQVLQRGVDGSIFLLECRAVGSWEVHTRLPG